MTALHSDRLTLSGSISRYRTRNWRRLWNLWGPLVPLAFGIGMLFGSWIVLLAKELGR